MHLAITHAAGRWCFYTGCAPSSSHCNALQHTATFHWMIQTCNALQHTATTHYNTQRGGGAVIPGVQLLHHTATHCNTLQHTATHCNTLQHTARWWCYCTGSAAALSLPLRSSTQRAFRVSSSTLPPTSSLILAPRSFSLHRSVLQRGAVYCSVLQCVAVCCSVLQCPTYIIPDSNHKIILNLRVCVATRCLSASPSGTAWYLCREQ